MQSAHKSAKLSMCAEGQCPWAAASVADSQAKRYTKCSVGTNRSHRQVRLVVSGNGSQLPSVHVELISV